MIPYNEDLFQLFKPAINVLHLDANGNLIASGSEIPTISGNSLLYHRDNPEVYGYLDLAIAAVDWRQSALVRSGVFVDAVDDIGKSCWVSNDGTTWKLRVLQGVRNDGKAADTDGQLWGLARLATKADIIANRKPQSAAKPSILPADPAKRPVEFRNVP